MNDLHIAIFTDWLNTKNPGEPIRDPLETFMGEFKVAHPGVEPGWFAALRLHMKTLPHNTVISREHLAGWLRNYLLWGRVVPHVEDYLSENYE